MKESYLQAYWDTIPVGKDNAVCYDELCLAFECDRRNVRKILHELGSFDSGDDYILIRSSKTNGFYRTDDKEDIIRYKRECISRGRSIFETVKKINRVLSENTEQYSFTNNLRVVRESLGLSQDDVCNELRIAGLDKFLLSKMENGICVPTEYQLMRLSALYGRTERELIDCDIYTLV